MLGKIFSWEIIFAARYYNSQISKLIDLKYTKMIQDTLSRKDSF